MTVATACLSSVPIAVCPLTRTTEGPQHLRRRQLPATARPCPPRSAPKWRSGATVYGPAVALVTLTAFLTVCTSPLPGT